MVQTAEEPVDMASTSRRIIDQALPAALNVAVGFENGVYYVLDSNIPGLNVEAQRHEDFVEIVGDLAPDLLDVPVSALPDICFIWPDP